MSVPAGRGPLSGVTGQSFAVDVGGLVWARHANGGGIDENDRASDRSGASHLFEFLLGVSGDRR